MATKVFVQSGILVALTISACSTNDQARTGVPQAGGQVNSNASMEAPAGDAQGIDVSYYEGTIDWQAVSAGGVDFAFIRVSDGDDFLDPQFAANWSGANAAGVIRGAYQFFRPEQSATNQANLLLSNMGSLQPGDLPPVLDVEVTDGESASTIRNRIATWVSIVQQATGLEPIIYCSPGFWVDLNEDSQSTSLWVANWYVSSPEIPSSWSSYTFWQYSATGSVQGLSDGGQVDLDVFNGTPAELVAWAGGSQPSPTSSPTPTPSASPTPTPDGVVYGVDVCTDDGTVNWNQVLAGGKQFGLIGVAFGETVDDQFAANWSGALSAGVIRGAWQLYEPSENATNQANVMLAQMGTLLPGDLPPTLDVEVTDGESASTVLNGIATWISVVQQATGVTPMIRTSPGFWEELGTSSPENTPLWVLHWGVASPASDLPSSWSSWQFWQYSDTGTVSGIPGSPDAASLDEFNGSLAQLMGSAVGG